MKELTHFNEQKRAQMVDITQKEDTKRLAKAEAIIKMEQETLKQIIKGKITKGDVLGVAQIAGIMAAKKTSELIPMCHPLMTTKADIAFGNNGKDELYITSTVVTLGKTGVEMEALTAVSTASLTVYDMCKAIDRSMVITQMRLLEKSGGKSGDFKRVR